VGLGDKIKRNPEQSAVYDAVGNFRTIVVEALAGTGKTTTLVACAQKIAKNKRVLYLAFNRAIVKETKDKSSGQFDCFTAHGLALQMLNPEHKNKFKRTKDRFFKGSELIKALNITAIQCTDIAICRDKELLAELRDNQRQKSKKELDRTEGWRFVHKSIVLETIENMYDLFVKSAEFELNRAFIERNIQSTLPYPWNHPNLNFVRSDALLDDIFTKCHEYWTKTTDTANDDFPFGYDEYLKIWQLSKPVLPYDLILFDEAQDADPVMVDVVKRQLAQVVWCGDSQQQIYGWRGAINILSSIHADKRLAIRTTQRFGRPIDQVANAFLIPLGDLKIEPNTKMSGEYRYEPPATSSVNETGEKLIREPVELELFRGNVPLLLRFADLVEHDYKVKVMADLEKFQDLIEGLIAIFHDQPCDLPFLARFETFADLVEYMNYLSRKRRKPSWYPEVLSLFMLQINTKDGNFYLDKLSRNLCPRWDRLLHATKRARLAKDDATVTLSTGHKAKGLQGDVVRVSQDFVDQSIFNQPRTVAEAKDYLSNSISEEYNKWLEHQRLCYVAVTRARRLLLHPFNILDIAEAASFQANNHDTQVEAPVEHDTSLPAWVNKIYAELAEFNISWSAVIKQEYRYRLNGWADGKESLSQIRIDVLVKKDDRPSSVEIRDQDWHAILPRLQRVLSIEDQSVNRPDLTPKTKTDLELVLTYAESKNRQVKWSEVDAHYQVQIKSVDTETEVWLFFGNKGLNAKSPSKTIGDPKNVSDLLQMIRESLS